MPTKHLLIKGKVQGVFYRATARAVAEQLGLTGWIRNTEEGHVETMITGKNSQLKDFINWCRQGPPRAVVAAVEETDVEEQTFAAFKVIRGS